MNDKDMTLDTFRSLIFEGIACLMDSNRVESYTITDEEIEEFWEEGYSIEEAIEYTNWKMECLGKKKIFEE